MVRKTPSILINNTKTEKDGLRKLESREYKLYCRLEV